MSFIKETNAKGAFIPRSALKMSGFRDNEEATLRTLPNALILTRRHMTAMELVNAIESLAQTAADLLIELVKLCGSCTDCNSECCPFDTAGGNPYRLDEDLRQEAGIPDGAKLCAQVDEVAHTVTFMISDHKHDLSDIPEGQLALLINSGICLGDLEKKLMSDEVIYHG